MKKFAPFFLTAALGLLVVSCSPGVHSSSSSASRLSGRTEYLAGFGPAGGVSMEQTQRSRRGYWDGDNVSGPAKIVIDRGEQQAYFYKGDTLVSITPVSTGSKTHRTPPGTFRVTEKDVDHRSSLYGVHRDVQSGQVINPDVDSRKDKVPAGAVYEGAPMWNFLRFNGGIGMHTGHLPGYPASHGCIRLPDHMAKKFYENSKLGTPVIVR